MHDAQSGVDPMARTALEHPGRAELLSHIKQGSEEMTVGQAADAVGIGPSLAKYHLRVLADAKLITRVVRTSTTQLAYTATSER